MADALASSPMLAPWTGPRKGAPPFDKVAVGDFEPAFREAMAQNRAEIAAIAANPEPPTFANTLVALEDSGRALGRVGALFGVWTSTLADEAMRAVERGMAPILAAFADEVIQNAVLFARIEAVYEARERLGLTAEQRRLTEVVRRRFARCGAALSPADKTRLAAINQRLAGLSTTFSQNVLADEEVSSLILTNEAELAGLPVSLIDAAAAAAKARGLAKGWLVANTRSAMEPFLTHSSRRTLREAGWRMWMSRGDNGDEHDNKAIVTEILGLRAEKARLLGYATFAHWITDDQMAGSPEAAMELMMKVWAPARARALQEIADLRAIANAQDPGSAVEPWDVRFYAEKVRKARYDLDEGEIKPYLSLDSLREATFWVAGQLYGLKFAEAALPVAHPEVRAFEVSREGRQTGLFYFDPYARAGKISGAWMSEYRGQERFAGEVTPIISNNANFMKGAPGDPVLVSWDDAVTLFHEFGHALHGLLSSVDYPSLAGTAVTRDFVEFPSQLNERWLATREVLGRFARHHRTGEAMPDALLAKIQAARVFNKGIDTIEYLASAIVDMKAHLAADAAIDPAAFELAALEEIGMPREVVMCHRLPHFGHIFAGEGYAAGYYDYIWADTLTADAAEAFAEAPGGFYDGPTARRLHDTIMSAGDTVEAAEAFRRFRGRDVAVEALMRDRGFAATA